MKERKRGRRESAQDFRRILDHKRTVMVGDSAVDVRTARNARVQAWGDRVGVSAGDFRGCASGFCDWGDGESVDRVIVGGRASVFLLKADDPPGTAIPAPSGFFAL